MSTAAVEMGGEITWWHVFSCRFIWFLTIWQFFNKHTDVHHRLDDVKASKQSFSFADWAVLVQTADYKNSQWQAIFLHEPGASSFSAFNLWIMHAGRPHASAASVAILLPKVKTKQPIGTHQQVGESSQQQDWQKLNTSGLGRISWQRRMPEHLPQAKLKVLHLNFICIWMPKITALCFIFIAYFVLSAALRGPRHRTGGFAVSLNDLWEIPMQVPIAWCSSSLWSCWQRVCEL